MTRSLKPILAIFLVVYLIFHLLALTLRQKRELSRPERWLVFLTAPLQSLVDRGIDSVSSGMNHYVLLVNVSRRNEELGRERDRLHAEMIQLREAERENSRLQALLDMKETSPLSLLAARRIAVGISPFERVIRVDRGSQDAVKAGAAVLHPQGVVGQIYQVYPRYSDILLLVDRSSAVDVVSQRSRARGILRGESVHELQLEYVSKDEDLVVGDDFITTGLDGVYPSGFPVGIVRSVDDTHSDLFLPATVKPHVDFGRLEEVMIVLGEKK